MKYYNQQELGTRIKKVRKFAGINQMELAKSGEAAKAASFIYLRHVWLTFE